LDAPENHRGGREVFAGLLRRLAQNNDEPSWVEAAVLFDQSVHALEKATDAVVDYLLRKGGTLENAAAIIGDIADIEERVFRIIGKG
jgi:hypothetical protein